MSVYYEKEVVAQTAASWRGLGCLHEDIQQISFHDFWLSAPPHSVSASCGCILDLYSSYVSWKGSARILHNAHKYVKLIVGFVQWVLRTDSPVVSIKCSVSCRSGKRWHSKAVNNCANRFGKLLLLWRLLYEVSLLVICFLFHLRNLQILRYLIWTSRNVNKENTLSLSNTDNRKTFPRQSHRTWECFTFNSSVLWVVARRVVSKRRFQTTSSHVIIQKTEEFNATASEAYDLTCFILFSFSFCS